MTTRKNLVEDWIAVRAVLSAQVATLKTSDTIRESDRDGDATLATPGTLARLKICIGELNALLKEHARLDHAA